MARILLFHEQREPGQPRHGDGMLSAVAFPVAVRELVLDEIFQSLVDGLLILLRNLVGMGGIGHMNIPGRQGEQATEHE